MDVHADPVADRDPEHVHGKLDALALDPGEAETGVVREPFSRVAGQVGILYSGDPGDGAGP